MPTLSLFPGNIFKDLKKVAFFRNKEKKENVRICYFDIKGIISLFTNANNIENRIPGNYKNLIISMKNKMFVFETKKTEQGFKKLSYVYYNDFLFSDIKKYEEFYPTKEEIKKYEVMYKELLKEIKESNIKSKAYYTGKKYEKITESLWNIPILYECIKYDDNLAATIKEGSNIYENIYKKADIKRKELLKYIKEIEFIKTDNEKQRIKDYIISSINTEKTLSVACIDSDKSHESFVFVERKNKYIYYLNVSIIYKNRDKIKESETIIINKKTDQNYTEKIDKMLNQIKTYR